MNKPIKASTSSTRLFKELSKAVMSTIKAQPILALDEE
jgi:hypothetical protein